MNHVTCAEYDDDPHGWWVECECGWQADGYNSRRDATKAGIDTTKGCRNDQLRRGDPHSWAGTMRRSGSRHEPGPRTRGMVAHLGRVRFGVVGSKLGVPLVKCVARNGLVLPGSDRFSVHTAPRKKG